MDKLDFEIKKVLKSEIDLPCEYTKMISYTLKNKNNIKKNRFWKQKLYRMLIGGLATILGTTGVCFASAKIYSEYILKQENIESSGLFVDENGVSNYETDFTQNDMIYGEEEKFLYKIINNYSDYKKYKSRVNELPEMSEDDFSEKIMLIVTWASNRELHEMDLEIKSIKSDDTTTYITLKQKENPNYNTQNNIIYSIILNKDLKSNIKVQFELPEFTSTNFVDAKNLPTDYSIEEAIKDGCFVLYNGALKSNNLHAIDEFINKSESGENCFIRIYCKENYDIRTGTFIYDVEFRDGVYYQKRTDISDINKESSFHSYEKILKNEDGPFGIEYYWVNNKKEIENSYYVTDPFVFIK